MAAESGAQSATPRRDAVNRARSSARLPIAAAIATILASICLGQIFLTGRWFLPAAGAVLVVIGANELARRNSIPRALVPFLGATALLVYLVERYARGETTLGFIPDASALQRLVEIAQQGNKDISRYAAPIGVLPGVELITVAGVGFVALVVDTLAVTARRAALAGLPLLALYTVPAALAPDGVSWQAFALAGAGYLGLMLTEAREKVTRWGRPMRYTPRTDWRDDVQTAPLAQLGRRVGAAALGIALIVPAVVPELSLGTIGFGEGGFGRGNGVGDRATVINPILDLGRDLRQGDNKEILRYEGPRTYLRMVGLDLFDGETWKPSRLRVPDDQTLENGLPRPPGLDPDFESRRKTHQITVGDLDQQWLPLPYPARRVEIDGRWLYDTPTFNVFSSNTSTRDKDYQVISRGVQPTADELRQAPRSSPGSAVGKYLQHPLNLPSVIQRTAEQVTVNALTDYDRALALQTWLRSPSEFTYSTRVPETVGDTSGSAALAAFLDARRGYCVHFASAMALMARLLNIPARVAVGFTPGTPKGGGYVVGLNDAHSWPELYFEGIGWVPFEPTPAARTGQPPSWAQPAPEQSTASTSASASPSPSSSASSTFNQGRTGIDDQAQGGAGDDQPLWQRLRLPLLPTLVVLGLLGLAMVPALTRLAVRRRRWRRAVSPGDKVAAAWTQLQDTLLDFGFTWQESDSPRRGAARAAKSLALPDSAAQAMSTLASGIERLRYAPAMTDEVGDLRAELASIDSALATGASRRRRLRARFLPASTRRVAAALSERFADGLDAFDAGAAKLRARLLLRPSARRG